MKRDSEEAKYWSKGSYTIPEIIDHVFNSYCNSICVKRVKNCECCRLKKMMDKGREKYFKDYL